MTKKDKKENLIYNINQAHEKLKFYWGLTLNLSEAIELRDLTKWTTEVYIRDKKNFSGKEYSEKYKTMPGLEAAMIFMNRNYGLQINSLDKLFAWNILRGRDLEERKYDWDDSFKKMQDDMHYP